MWKYKENVCDICENIGKIYGAGWEIWEARRWIFYCCQMQRCFYSWASWWQLKYDANICECYCKYRFKFCKYFALLHNSQFELTLACQLVFCTQHSVHMTQKVLTGWNVNVCIGVKNPMKSSHFWTTLFCCGIEYVSTSIAHQNVGNGQFVGNENVTIPNVETVTGQERFVWK